MCYGYFVGFVFGCWGFFFNFQPFRVELPLIHFLKCRHCSNRCWLLRLSTLQSALRRLYGICLLLSHCVPAESMRSPATRSEHPQGPPGAQLDRGSVFYIRDGLLSAAHHQLSCLCSRRTQ